MIENVAPADIEKKSFAIIADELYERGISLPHENKNIIMRAIHTTADFDYASSLEFSPGAVAIAKDHILSGSDIVTDTNMAAAGINKRELARHGGNVRCYMADESVAAEAKQRGITRAAVSMERAAASGQDLIFAIGNAPTSLITLRRLMDEGYKPAFIIAVPVGFVNVVAAKELIVESDVDYIVNRGRKGGSNVAAAIVNALLYELRTTENNGL